MDALISTRTKLSLTAQAEEQIFCGWLYTNSDTPLESSIHLLEMLSCIPTILGMCRTCSLNRTTSLPFSLCTVSFISVANRTIFELLLIISRNLIGFALFPVFDWSKKLRVTFSTHKMQNWDQSTRTPWFPIQSNELDFISFITLLVVLNWYLQLLSLWIFENQ